MKLLNKKTPMSTRPVFSKKTGLRSQLAGFTLVELIVVISILAILWTIAFLSFGWFSSKARDGSRISDTSSLSKWLELYSVTAWKYPVPEWITWTWKINTTEVAYLWTIQNQISTLTKISKTPRDPLSDNYYIYWTTFDYKQYQIATTLENTLSLNNWSEGKVYADSQAYSARVLGNYKWLIKFNSWTTNPTTWISNIPSLIYNSWTNLLSQSTRYIVNKSTNLPYILKDSIQWNISPDEIVKQITNQPTATLTWVQITNLTQTWITELFTNSPQLLASFGWDLSSISKIILGSSSASVSQDDTPTPTNSCNTTQPACSSIWCTLTTWTPTTVNQDWVKWASNCWFICNANYSWVNCEIYTAPIVQWRDIPWTNCNQDDINIWWKTWAGCNSILGTWLTYNAWANNCYNYTWNYTAWSTACYWDITKENTYNSTYWVDNIWWKLYTWANAPSACPTWWHVPEEQDFLNLEIALTCTDSATDWTWRCNWLGWKDNILTKTKSNNVVRALNLPLAGYGLNDVFYDRGNRARLWSSTEYNSTNIRGRGLARNDVWVLRDYRDKSNNFSVRCIKD